MIRNGVAALAMLVGARAALAAPLPLASGNYVVVGQSCNDAPFAATARFDGRGFSGPHATGCTSSVLARSGRTYRIRTTCTALGDGTPARPGSFMETYTINSPTSFIRRAAFGAQQYRLCTRR